MASSVADIVWGGRQDFGLTGTGRGEDTLRVEANRSDPERLLGLTLPTLCITYANMSFANAVGGRQENYPASRQYGPAFFDPPVEMDGADEVEKVTWIRGAVRVVIGPRTTEIWWPMGRSLVVPRLRLDRQHAVTASLSIPDTPIAVSEPLVVDVTQLADGRQLGGIRIEKRHPQWTPPPERHDYDLWAHVVNGESLEPMPEVELRFFRWDQALMTHYGPGGFALVDIRHTDGKGAVHAPSRPSEELEAVVLHLPGWRAVARCFRALPGQPVRLHMAAWELHESAVPYIWHAGDTLGGLAPLSGHSAEAILAHNRFPDASGLQLGMAISLPCYEGRYRLEGGDTLEWLADAFAYSGIEELAALNGGSLHSGSDVRLPGWNFFSARQGETLDGIDRMFDLPPGSSRPVGRVHRPDPRVPFAAETIAVPTPTFAQTHLAAAPE